MRKTKNGSREHNEVKRPDHPAFDPVTALRSRLPLGTHNFTYHQEPS